MRKSKTCVSCLGRWTDKRSCPCCRLRGARLAFHGHIPLGRCHDCLGREHNCEEMLSTLYEILWRIPVQQWQDYRWTGRINRILTKLLEILPSNFMAKFFLRYSIGDGHNHEGMLWLFFKFHLILVRFPLEYGKFCPGPGQIIKTLTNTQENFAPPWSHSEMSRLSWHNCDENLMKLYEILSYLWQIPVEQWQDFSWAWA